MTSPSNTPKEFADNYPEAERQKLTEIRARMKEWEGKGYVSNFVTDGFYPYYYSQHPRVLFIGREAHGIADCNYIEYFLPAYRAGDFGNPPHFHNRLFYMMRAIACGSEKWDQVPNPAELAKDFASEGHTSFAFMNLNKDSNMTNTRTRWKQLRAFIEKSKDFIGREIEILDPDLIITANLFDWLPTTIADVFPGSSDPIAYSSNKNLAVREWKNNGHQVYIFDTFHWSGWRLPAGITKYQRYYACVRDAYRKYFLAGQ